ncbi:MAG: hypothetical protein WD740_06095 [Anaerolineales bacterium]
MKRFALILITLTLVQSACAFSAEPTATEIVLPTETATEAASSTATETELPPAPTGAPTETLAASDTPEPSETPTITPTPTQPPFDPLASYGQATIFDNMDTDRNWAGRSGLPDDDYIRLALGGGGMHVTGKLANWDTWWYTASTPADFFIQMKVDTGNCTGKQAYGLILRGPQTEGAEARGYIFTFSCDGNYRLDRLDDTAPYTKVELIPWTPSDHINVGSNETNLIGVRMIGADISLYANGFFVADRDDDEYLAGRFGLFVNAGDPGSYTFTVDELSYWNLD